MNKTTVFLATALLIATISPAAQAYVGPGAGLTMLSSLWGLILAVVFVIGGLLVLPVRILLRKRKSARAAREDEAATEDSPTA